MLSAVLHSPRAIEANILIMRAFVRLREVACAHRELAVKLGELERRIESHDADICSIFDAIRDLMTPPKGPSRQIGFKPAE